LHLRERGAMQACVVTDAQTTVEEAVATAAGQPSMAGRALVAGVSAKAPYEHTTDGRVRVAVVDYGVKRSVLRRLAHAGAQVTVYPHDADADTLASYDGVLLSPGPGDPSPLTTETATVRDLLGRTDVFGICLGHQLLAQATDHVTFKLPFGHRGTNHPVLERASGRVLVTSQNHGFAVRPSDAAEVSHVSLYDGTVEALDLPDLRARSLQFHPEAGPGPHDAWPLLEAWVDEVAEAVGA
jgi:carbamoyl-phosphate synthase small subunit